MSPSYNVAHWSLVKEITQTLQRLTLRKAIWRKKSNFYGHRVKKLPADQHRLDSRSYYLHLIIYKPSTTYTTFSQRDNNLYVSPNFSTSPSDLIPTSSSVVSTKLDTEYAYLIDSAYLIIDIQLIPRLLCL